MTKETGGAAFPFHCDVLWQGMDLRDYFAAKAMQALLSSPDWRGNTDSGLLAHFAYKMADAMLEARKK